jgi:hypothetical protein
VNYIRHPTYCALFIISPTKSPCSREAFSWKCRANTSSVVYCLTELLRRLDQEEEPLPKRLRLALAAFESNDLPIQQKEELILKWLCEYGEKNQNTEGIWSVLKACFNSSHMKKLSGTNIRPPVKCSVSQVRVCFK